MRPILLKTHLLGALLASALAAAGASGDRVYIGYVYPAGGQQGTSFEAKTGGEYIYGAVSAVVSGTGVTVQIINSRDPSEGKDPDKKKQKRKNQAVIDEVVTMKVTIAPDAAPGDREIRLIAPEGPSNPLRFQVGQFKEVRETEPNDKNIKTLQLLELPVLINGQIMLGDTDMFKFQARKGQHLVAEVSARGLIPYLADAVPGWFQATLTLFDAKGREVAFVDDYRFQPDPVMFYEVPEDGEYRLMIRDSISRGRADFVYRMRLGEQPFVTSVFPLGAAHGDKPAVVRIAGKNLPGDTTSVDVSGDAPRVASVSVATGGVISSPVQFAIGNAAEVLENETLTGKTDGQVLVPPVVVNGRIGIAGESDFYRFDGKQGQRICLEVRARRLGSPLDSCLIVSNARGERVAENDDAKDRAEGLLTHQPDSALICELPEDGFYTIRLFDAQGKGGDEYSYRLSVGPPVPDFALRATPASLHVPKGGSTVLTVHLIRRCGFNGEIRLALDPASAPGCTLDGAFVPAGTNRARVTISAPEETAAVLFSPRLTGSAVVDGTAISRPVLPAEELMQAFIYQHLVPAAECLMTVAASNVPFRVVPVVDEKGCLELPLGKEATFKVKVTRQPGFAGGIRLQLEDPPRGITLRKAAIPEGKDSASVTVRTESKVEAGLNGSLILSGIMTLERVDPSSTNVAAGQAAGVIPTNAAGAKAVAGGNTNTVAGDAKVVVAKPIREKFTVTLPAVPFRVVEKAGRK